jgi:hypothetical protein
MEKVAVGQWWCWFISASWLFATCAYDTSSSSISKMRDIVIKSDDFKPVGCQLVPTIVRW